MNLYLGDRIVIRVLGISDRTVTYCLSEGLYGNKNSQIKK